MICPNCKKKVSKSNRFCTHCGTKISTTREEGKYPNIPNKYRIEYVNVTNSNQNNQKEISHRISFWERIKSWRDHGNKRFLWAILIISFAFLAIYFEGDDGFIDIFDNDAKFGVVIGGFPEAKNPRIIDFEWEYNGLQYSIKTTLYKSIYDYYFSETEKDWLSTHTNELAFFDSFLEVSDKDNIIHTIAKDIVDQSHQNSLSEDQIAENIISFVQSIPYDSTRALMIEKTSNIEEMKPRHPYEVLYDNRGVCSGKSFLTVLLLEEVGFGSALFFYDLPGEMDHLAPAVKCAEEYSSFDSGYCHAEVSTEGFKIGILPEIEKENSIPVARFNADSFVEHQIQWVSDGSFTEPIHTPSQDFVEIKNPRIYSKRAGDIYNGIIQTKAILDRIEKIEGISHSLEIVVNSKKKKLPGLENQIKIYKKIADEAYDRHLVLGDRASYNEYSRLYNIADASINEYKQTIKSLDNSINEYNQNADEYNLLIEKVY